MKGGVWLYITSQYTAAKCFRICGCKNIVMAAWMWHGACVEEEARERNIVFFRIKWFRSAKKGTSCARQLRGRSFWRFFFLPRCSCGLKLLWMWLRSAQLQGVLEFGAADLSGMVAWLLPSCFATLCCNKHYNGCKRLVVQSINGTCFVQALQYKELLARAACKPCSTK